MIPSGKNWLRRADLSGKTGIDVRAGRVPPARSPERCLSQPGPFRDEGNMSWHQDKWQYFYKSSLISGAGIGLAILAAWRFAVLDSLPVVFARLAYPDVHATSKIVAVPRIIGILLAASLLARLCVTATSRIRSWT